MNMHLAGDRESGIKFFYGFMTVLHLFLSSSKLEHKNPVNTKSSTQYLSKLTGMFMICPRDKC